MALTKLTLPTKRYGTIYADPGWLYDNKRTGGSMKSGSSQQYMTMSLADLLALDVKALAKQDSVLFLWVTVPLIDYGLAVLKEWGFKYKTTIFWHKSTKRGMGFWTRGDVEMLLLGVRGKVKPFRSPLSNHISHPRLAHSEKPEVFRELIEYITLQQLTLLSPRLELFARKRVTGWDAWGNQLSDG